MHNALILDQMQEKQDQIYISIFFNFYFTFFAFRGSIVTICGLNMEMEMYTYVNPGNNFRDFSSLVIFENYQLLQFFITTLFCSFSLTTINLQVASVFITTLFCSFSLTTINLQVGGNEGK